MKGHPCSSRYLPSFSRFCADPSMFVQKAMSSEEKLPPPYPTKALVALGLSFFAHCYALSSLFPYVGYMVKDLGFFFVLPFFFSPSKFCSC